MKQYKYEQAQRIQEQLGELAYQPHLTEVTPGAKLSFQQAYEAAVGQYMPPDVYAENALANQFIEEQTSQMALKLESVGVQTKINGPAISMVCLLTGQHREIPSYRNICFLPSVAKRNRRPYLNTLEYYVTHKAPSEYWRYMVVTAGDLIPVKHGKMNLKRQIVWFKKRLSRWRERICRKYHMDVVLQAIEMPMKNGKIHLHANILYKPNAFLVGNGWNNFLQETKAAYGEKWFKESGRIKNIREMVKYPFKPNEVRDASAHDLKWFFENTFGMRIVEFLGGLRSFKTELKNSKRKVFRINGNLAIRDLEHRFDDRDGFETELDSLDPDSDAMAEALADQDAIEVRDTDHEQTPELPKSVAENIVLCRMMPNFAFGNFAAPSALILNYQPRPILQASQDRLAYLAYYQDDARRIWREKGLPDPRCLPQLHEACINGDAGKIEAIYSHYIVHNGTISSHAAERQGDVIELVDSDPPDPPENSSNFGSDADLVREFIQIFS